MITTKVSGVPITIIYNSKNISDICLFQYHHRRIKIKRRMNNFCKIIDSWVCIHESGHSTCSLHYMQYTRSSWPRGR